MTGSHNAIAKDIIVKRPEVANRPTPNMLKDQLARIHLKQAEDIKAGKTPAAPTAPTPAVASPPAVASLHPEEAQKKGRERPGFISKSKTKLTSMKKSKDSTVKRANSASQQGRERAATTTAPTAVLKSSPVGLSARQRYTSVTLQQVLLLMGLKDTDHMQVMNMVNGLCDPDFMLTEFSPAELPIMQSIGERAQEVRLAQSNTGKIVKAQAFVRGFLVRKQLRGISASPSLT